MDTIELIECLLYKIPNIRNAFLGLNIMSLERKISASEHSEFLNLIKPFNNPKIISIIGLISTTMIIEPVKNGKTYPVIIINGYKSEILDISKTKIYNTLYNQLSLKDYLPEPFVKKIIYIHSYSKELKGVIFSEYCKNMWTINSPLELPITSFQKISGKNIINEIILDVLK